MLNIESTEAIDSTWMRRRRSLHSDEWKILMASAVGSNTANGFIN